MLQLGQSGACAEVYRMEGCLLDSSFLTLTFKTVTGSVHELCLQSASGSRRAGSSGICSHEGYGN